MIKGLQLVAFKIGKELFGVGIESIREIVRFPDITEVPDAPAFLEGVINLRGKIVPVIDLRKRLRLGGEENTRSTRVLITENGRNMIGLHVDSVSEVLKIQPDDIEEPPEMVSAIGVEYITGVAKVAERLVILLDLKKILSVEDLKKLVTGVERVAEPQAA
ncbi:MAG: purine-binding chemotaxis protein CheW [Nitrospirae bacterium]|nr:purine-binding chemotaxis protein CheW [Nitrospirota bacterium]